jgi:transposase
MMTRGSVSDDKVEEIIAMTKAGMRTQQIAAEVELASSTVYKIIAEAGLDPVKAYAPTSYRSLSDEEEDRLAERYYAMVPVVELLDDFGLTHTQLYLFLSEKGLEPRTRQKELRDARKLAIDHAVRLYVETNMTVAEIVNETGVHQPVISSEIRKRGIPQRRPRKEYDSPPLASASPNPENTESD